MTEATTRFGLPLLVAGQAQKEIVHNEAVTAIDLLVQPVVQAIGTVVPPAAPAVGQSWIAGTTPTGAWAGEGGALASWTGGGWRFSSLPTGASVWRADQACHAVLTGAGWSSILPTGGVAVAGNQVVGARGAGVADPSGGSVIDGEARAAIVAILSRLKNHGLIAP